MGSTSIKAARKTLVTLTPGFNFINILRTAFMQVDPECAKKTVKSALSFYAFGLRELVNQIVYGLSDPAAC